MTRPDSGSRHAAVFGHGDGSAMALLFAATNPDRLTALILASGCHVHICIVSDTDTRSRRVSR